MARARYQVLVIPYCIMDGQARFCVFRRNDLDIWQFIAGGGEDEDASILESAKREAFEEAGIPVTCDYSPLDTLQHTGQLLRGCGSTVGQAMLCRSRICLCGKGRKHFPALIP